MLAPFVVIARAEIRLAGIANIGLRVTNFALRNPVTVGELELTTGLGALGVDTPLTQINTEAKEVVGDVAEAMSKNIVSSAP